MPVQPREASALGVVVIGREDGKPAKLDNPTSYVHAAKQDCKRTLGRCVAESKGDIKNKGALHL